jgi:aubergine-like protein
MVVGFDVSNNSKDKRMSYGALVASMDRAFSRWYSTVSTHTSPEELSDELSANLLKALHQFRKNNEGNLPARIIIYRDGVGDGQIDFVCKVEVDTMRVSFPVCQCQWR